MSRLHFNNGGVIGGPLRTEGGTSGIWKLGSLKPQYIDLVLPPIPATTSTDLGFPIPTSQGGREYYFGSRKLKIFYTDAYNSTDHISQNSVGSASYTDARHIANADGVGSGANTFLVNLPNSRTGYIYDSFLTLSGVIFYGDYMGVPMSSQGSFVISTYNGTAWIDVATVAGTSAMNAAPGYTYNFGSALVVKGIAIRPTFISSYCPISYMAGIDSRTSTHILGIV
jgi:hypothetical protein